MKLGQSPDTWQLTGARVIDPAVGGAKCGVDFLILKGQSSRQSRTGELCNDWFSAWINRP